MATSPTADGDERLSSSVCASAISMSGSDVGRRCNPGATWEGRTEAGTGPENRDTPQLYKYFRLSTIWYVLRKPAHHPSPMYT